ncbi:hypothetical protein ABPG72_012068 [Tetrahymena utriculariae]
MNMQNQLKQKNAFAFSLNYSSFEYLNLFTKVRPFLLFINYFQQLQLLIYNSFHLIASNQQFIISTIYSNQIKLLESLQKYVQSFIFQVSIINQISYIFFLQNKIDLNQTLEKRSLLKKKNS